MRAKRRLLAYAAGQLVAVATLLAVVAALLDYWFVLLDGSVVTTTAPVAAAQATYWATVLTAVGLSVAFPLVVGWSLVGEDGQSPWRVGPWVLAALLAGPLVFVVPTLLVVFMPSTFSGILAPAVITVGLVAVVTAVEVLGDGLTPDGISPMLFVHVPVLATFGAAYVFVPFLALGWIDGLVVTDPWYGAVAPLAAQSEAAASLAARSSIPRSAE